MRVLLIYFLLGLTALVGEDLSAIDSLTASFERQRSEAESALLATYADQLEELQQQLKTKGDATAQAQVSEEIKVTKAKLRTLETARAAADNVHEADADSVFSDEDDAAAAKLSSEKKIKIVRLPMRNAALTPLGKMGRDHWLQANAAAKFLVRSAPTGHYRIRAIFHAKKGESGGRGVLEIAGSSEPISFNIASTKGDWAELIQQDIAQLDIVKCPINLNIRSVGLSAAEFPLFELVALWLVPESSGLPKLPR